MKWNLLCLGVFLLLLAAGCSRGPDSGIEKSNFDTTVRPQDDLYRFVNGAWLDRTVIPADKSNYGAFSELFEQSELDLKAIIEEAAAAENKTAGSEQQQVGDFYLSYMDSARLEVLGIQPVQDDLDRIRAVQSKDELVGMMGYFATVGVQNPFYYYINQDSKQSDQYIGYIGQSGLGLPDRDYYFNEDVKFQDFKNKYVAYMTELLKMLGENDPGKKARKMLMLESDLAKAHWTRVQNRDRDKTYNKLSVAQLDQLTPGFAWSMYLNEAQIPDTRNLIVRQPSYFKTFSKIFKKYPLEDWKTYYSIRVLDGAAPYLNEELVDLHFNFYGKTLSGIEELSPRWKRAVGAIDNVLGEAVGKLYVQKHFKPEAKERMTVLVNNLKAAYAERIKQLDWMSDETKEKALLKLSKFRAKIGYPDKWKDYSGLDISKDELFLNMKRAILFNYEQEINKLGNPIDRDEWFMTPQTVNAYYNPTMNEIVFPAAILQPPFFNLEAEDAANYGAIGAVIGHEMTHGFDDQGRKSDGDGNLTDWWTEQDSKNFEKRASVLVEQFNKYVVIDSSHINGELTLGENIADLGGLTIAHQAYIMSLNGKQAPVIDNWTGDQRFFFGWAQIWRRKYRDDELRKRLLTDPHSPSSFRVMGPVVNMPEFYAAFDISENDKLYLPADERVQIW